MRTSLKLSVAAIVAFGLAVACGKSNPAGPTSTIPSATSPTAVPTRVAINGPASAAPGQAVAYTATATMSDLSQQDYTRKVSWSSSPSNVLLVNASTGEGSAGIAGDAQVYAFVRPGAGYAGLNASLKVLVVPPNTYRLTGKVLESATAVEGATVSVTAGTGTGQSATTAYDGAYRLYGVAGPVEITVRKDGYDTITKAITVAANDVLDFPEARQTNGFPVIAGNYTLTIAPDACRPAGSIPSLPADLLKARSYSALIMQNGPELLVVVSGEGFSSASDHFKGRILPTGIEFSLGDTYYFGYGPDYAFSVSVSATNVLSYGGYVRAARSGSIIQGSYDGVLGLYEKSTFYRLVGECPGTQTLTLSPVTASSARAR
jgi:Carboxypeptidase regulatory-like domain